MKGETGTFPSEDPRPVGLLQIQSEELARKLQVEAEAIDGGGESGLDHGGSPAAVETAVGSVIAQPMTSQGAWGTPGRSGADLLRSPSYADPQRLQPPSQSHNRTGAPAKLPTAATADAAVLPGVPLSAGAVGALVAMGIEESWAAAALRRCGGLDVARAVEFCFSHDMDALTQEDAAAYASTAQAGVDDDGDMAFAVALEQEERRAFEARRAVAATARAEEEGTFGPKVRVAAVAAAAPHPRNDVFSSLETQLLKRPERWGLAEADALVDEDDGDTPPRGEGAEFGRAVGEEDEDENDSGGDVGGGLRSIPGGGRRKGKMPLFRNAAGEVVSKHDAIICGRMNAREASTFEGVGDLAAAGVRLDNRTFNSLKRNILKKKQEKGIAAGERVEGATRSTQEGVMDPRTRLLVFKMINAGTLLEVHGIVKTGKEAHVYHALAPEDPDSKAQLAGVRGVALKIFRTTLSEFGNRAAYIDGDPRYPNIRFNKQSRGKMFSIWAKKEHRNLIRLHRSGLPCPEPILQREHTIVMSFVGEEHWPAPQLREVELSGSKWRRCYLQVLELVRLMFLRCRLVHGDLSEYNLLYHRKVCYVIDVGQAVDTGHPKSREFLARDLSVVTDFFRRKGVSRCLDPSLAEAFVVSYRGPSDALEAAEEGGLAGPAGRASGGGGDRGREPPTGEEVIAELMDTSVDEADEALRSACEAAEPWADGVYGEDNIDDDTHDGIDDDIVEEDIDDDIGEGAGDELEGEGEGQEEVLGRSNGPGSETLIAQNHGGGGEGVIAPGGRAAVEVLQGKGVDEGGGGSSGERGATKRVGDGARKGKVEIGDRERARMADLKEALKAGILGIDS